MTRTCRRSVLTCALVAGSAATILTSPSDLHAREAYLVAGNDSAWVEVQGGNGWMLIPNSGFTYSLPGGTSPSAIATDGTSAYLLTTGTFNSTKSIWTYDLSSGSLTATTALQAPSGNSAISDIALLNGTLYGVAGPTSFSSNSTTRIYSIGISGTLTNVYSSTNSWSATPQLAANAQTNRLLLTPIGSSSSGLTTTNQLIDPSNWSVTQSVAGPSLGQIAFNLDGSKIIGDKGSSFLGSQQSIYAVPGLTPVSMNVSFDDVVGHAKTFGSVLSDAFDFPLPAGSPAVVELVHPLGRDLFRTGQHLWGTWIGIDNYLVPDGTTVDQIKLANVTWQQSGGPTVTSTNVTNTLTGFSSPLSLADARFSSDVTGAARGVYTLTGTLAIQGRYTTAAGSETRAITVSFGTISTSFAIDPVSSNLVGNGDGELGNFGWDGAGIAPDSRTNSPAIWLPSSAFAHSSTFQYLELGTPKTPMVLSFDYDVAAYSTTGAVDLTVLLDFVQIASISDITYASGIHHFSVTITDPRFQGLVNPQLDFQGLAKGTSSIVTLFVDNVSLTAVPEPSTFAACGLATISLVRRRLRS